MKFKDVITILFLLILCPGRLAAAEYIQLPGVVHVHSTVSSGLYSLDELATLAKEAGLEVLVMTDNDLAVMEYGVFPLRNLLKKRVEQNSVIRFGPERYLSLIAKINQRQKDVVVIPGVQSSPFYYWTGSALSDNLTAHNYRKKLLLIGMMKVDDYLDLPLQHRGFSIRYVKDLFPQSLVFLFSFGLGIYLIFQRGYFKAAGVIIALLSMVLLINHHPFRSSRFDPYHGDQGITPYQDLIDYVNAHGGLAFWAHPESNYSKSETMFGPFKMMTTPYADSLLEAGDYTGFSAIYGDAITLTDPGKKWDQLLNEYCSGRRRHPAWGIAGANYQGAADGVRLDSFQTIFVTRSKSVLHIMDALAKGRTYAKLKDKGGGVTLNHFSVEDVDTGERALMGADLNISSYPVIRADITSDDQVQHAVKVLLIKGGAVLHQFSGETPLEFVYEDKAPWVSKSYYRIEVQGGSAGKLLSNPIFADRKIPSKAVAEHSQKPPVSIPDKAVITEKAKLESFGAVSKQASSPGVRIDKKQESRFQTPPGENTISDKKNQKLPNGQLRVAAMPVPYSIQIASMPSFELAQKILQDLRLDLPVYHVKVNLGDKGIWWRVYVGYFATQKEAMAAREAFGLQESIIQNTPYANQVGVYASMQEMAAIRRRLEAMGYTPYVVRRSAAGYHLYVGAFVTLKGAENLQRELKTKGITAVVVKR